MFCEFILFLKVCNEPIRVEVKGQGEKKIARRSVWTEKKNVVNVNIANAPVLVKVFNKDS